MNCRTTGPNAVGPSTWLTAAMDEQDNDGTVDIEVETEILDADDDGTVDAVRETTTTVIDVDGDGVPDIVQQTTTIAVDVDGDGVPDVVGRTTVTGVDLDGDGTIDENEIDVEVDAAAREDLVDDDDTAATWISAGRHRDGTGCGS